MPVELFVFVEVVLFPEAVFPVLFPLAVLEEAFVVLELEVVLLFVPDDELVEVVLDVVLPELLPFAVLEEVFVLLDVVLEEAFEEPEPEVELDPLFTDVLLVLLSFFIESLIFTLVS